ncbi:hypothetical protein CDL15_Pgr018934 [Punica granatum]|nr:hypothetical protein CDL15_Pgr018934 [Punica granatum]
MIQPHDSWDYDLGVANDPISSSSLLSKPLTVETRCGNNLERNELSEWVERVTRQLIDDSEAGSESLQAEPTVGSSDDSTPRRSARRNYLDAGTNNGNPFHWNENESLACYNSSESNSGNSNSNRGLSRLDEHALSLITLLLECAVAISVDDLGKAHRILLELTQMASPYGPSCAERVVAYFAKAMLSRVVNSWLGICSPLVDYKSIHSAFQFLNNISPFVKFAHFTSNQAILEAFHRQHRVHIIDLDIMQGLQWPALFHILATRMEGPPQITMTAVGNSAELLTDTGKKLSNFARRLGIVFEFHPVAKKFSEIDPSALQVRRGETLAVHWLQHSLYDVAGSDWKMMRLLEQLAPRVITLVEQDIVHGGSFLDRFVGALHYYSTVFDSLGAYLSPDDSNRHKVEHCLLHQEINNILAIGGPARSGEDKYRTWRNELFGRTGSFLQIPMSANAMAQAQLILNMFPPAHGYSLVQADGTLKLGWKDTSLYTASAWTSQHA